MKNKRKKQGLSLIEIVISVGIFTLIAPAVTILSLKSVAGADEKDFAMAIAMSEEGLEAARSIRDHGWNDLTVGTHGITRVNGYFALNGGSDQQNGFVRTVSISEEASDERKVTSTVTWSSGKSMTLKTVLTDWENAISGFRWIQTADDDFFAGIGFDNVMVTADENGELKKIDEDGAGEFISMAFDTGYQNPGYQTLEWVAQESEGLKFQLRTSNSENGLNSAVWLGPDGTRNSYYTISGTPIVTKGGEQWVQYRASFDEEREDTVLKEVSVIYDPIL